MKFRILLSIVCITLFYGCKKDSNVIPIIPVHTQVRTADIFGHPLNSETPCLKKMYYDDTSVAVHFIYDTSGLLISAVSRNAGVEYERVMFYYDAQNRLSRIDAEDEFILQYGSNNRISKMISNQTDTTYFTYPSSNMIIAYKSYGTSGGVIDTLKFDNQYNLTSFASWYVAPGLPDYPNGTYTVSHHPSAKSPFDNNAIGDLYFIMSIFYSELFEGTGPKVITDITSDGIYYSRISLVDSQININQYPAYLKYKHTYGSNVEFYESHYVYSCD